MSIRVAPAIARPSLNRGKTDQDLFAARMQGVKVASLRHTLSMLRLFGQVISLDERNALEVGAEHASRKQSRHACTEYDGVALVCRA